MQTNARPCKPRAAAKGNVPHRIVHHLGDCFDSIKDLDFKEETIEIENEEGKKTGEQITQLSNIINGMVAKDGEKVTFPERFTLEGQVENYLNDLVGVMQNCLKTILNVALDAAAAPGATAPGGG